MGIEPTNADRVLHLILHHLYTRSAFCILIVACLTSFVVLISCSGTDRRVSAHSFEIFEANGIQIARSIGEPKYQDDLFEYDLLFELTEDSTRVESLLYQPHDFLMDDRGYFFVLDGGNHRIAVFDNLGRFAYSIGRQGGGPGEFGRTFYITEIRGDTLHVLDRSQNRITRFHTEGSLIDVIPVRRPNYACQYVYHLTEDRFLSLGTEQTNPNIGPVSMRAISFVHNSRGDTLLGRSAPWIYTHYAIPGDMNANKYPLGAQPSSSYQHGFGWIVTDGSDPVLKIWNASGEIRQRIELDLPRLPVTRKDYDLHRASIDWAIDFVDYIQEVLDMPDAYEDERKSTLRNEREHFKLSEYRAFWQSVYIDDTGFIWLKVPEHFIEEEEADARPRYMVLSPEGEMLGYTRVPKANPFNIRHGHFLASEWILEETRNSLKVYRIQPVVGGLSYPQ